MIRLADLSFKFLFPANVFPFNNLLDAAESPLLLFSSTFSSLSILNSSYSLWEIPLSFAVAIWTKVDLSCPSIFSSCVLLGSFTSMWFNFFRTSTFGSSTLTASFGVSVVVASAGAVIAVGVETGTAWFNTSCPTSDCTPWISAEVAPDSAVSAIGDTLAAASNTVVGVSKELDERIAEVESVVRAAGTVDTGTAFEIKAAGAAAAAELIDDGPKVGTVDVNASASGLSSVETVLANTCGAAGSCLTASFNIEVEFAGRVVTEIPSSPLSAASRTSFGISSYSLAPLEALLTVRGINPFFWCSSLEMFLFTVSISDPSTSSSVGSSSSKL